MPQFVTLHDIVEDNGKTIRENNLERGHAIPLGSLVEIAKSEDDAYAGVRMYVVKHTRDCDGTPLYSLAPNGAETNPWNMHGGWDDDTLSVVQPTGAAERKRQMDLVRAGGIPTERFDTPRPARHLYTPVPPDSHQGDSYDLPLAPEAEWSPFPDRPRFPVHENARQVENPFTSSQRDCGR